MAKCEVCNKETGVKNHLIITRSHISKRTRKPQKANIKTVRVLEHGERRKKQVCTHCIRAGKIEKA